MMEFMGIVSLFYKYKALNTLNKYSLFLIYSFFAMLLLIISILVDLILLRVFLLISFLITSFFLYNFYSSKRKRMVKYDSDISFPLVGKDFLLLEFSSIFCAGCLPVRNAVDRISKNYSNILVIQIEARNIEKKYIGLVEKLNLSVPPTICLLDKNGELISKRLAHVKPEMIEKRLVKELEDSVS